MGGTSGAQASRVEGDTGQMEWSLEGCREKEILLLGFPGQGPEAGWPGVQSEGSIFPEELGQHNPVLTDPSHFRGRLVGRVNTEGRGL